MPREILGTAWLLLPIDGGIAIGKRSLFGPSVLALAVRATLFRVAVSAAIVAGIHPVLTLAGYLLGMRPTAR